MPGNPRMLDVPLPTDGIDLASNPARRGANVTTDMLNMRGFDATAYRLNSGIRRLARRPGSEKYVVTRLGDAATDYSVRMIQTVRPIQSTGFDFFQDTFASSEWGTGWTAAYLRSIYDGLPARLNGYAQSPPWPAAAENADGCAAFVPYPDDIDIDEPYSVSITPVFDPDNGFASEAAATHFIIYLCFNDPYDEALAVARKNSVSVDFELGTGGFGTWDVTLIERDSTGAASTTTTDSDPFNGVIPVTGEFRVAVHNDVASGDATGRIVRVYWNGEQVLTHTCADSSVQGNATPYAGFRMTMGGTEGNRAAIDTFTMQYHRAVLENDDELENELVASAGGNLYALNQAGTAMDPITADHEFEYNRPFSAVEYMGLLYISDAQGRERYYATDPTWKKKFKLLAHCKVEAPDAANSNEVTIENLDGGVDWQDNLGLTDAGAGGGATDPNSEYAIEVFNVQGQFPAGTYTIVKGFDTDDGDADSFLRGKLQIKGGAHESTGDYYCSVRVTKPPKVYDPSTGTLSAWRAKPGFGYVPLDCPLIAVFMNRLVLAGMPSHVFYMSRVGDPRDWFYGASSSDTGRAIRGTVVASGDLFRKMTAMIPYQDDYLIFGYENALYVLRGDPAAGGGIDALDRQSGIVAPHAWEFGPKGELYIINHNGLCVLPPGGYEKPIPLSKPRMPRAFAGVAWETHDIGIAYDERTNGLHVWAVPYTPGTDDYVQSNRPGEYYFVDLANNSIWPDTRHEDRAFTQAVTYHRTLTGDKNDIAQESEVIYGTRNGYLLRDSDAAVTDDGYSVAEYADFGPIMIGGSEDLNGLLDEIHCSVAETPGATSTSLTCELYVGATAEEAVANTASNPFYSTTFNETGRGRNFVARPRASGCWALIRLSGSAEVAWALERLAVRLKPFGRYRRY